MSVSCEECPLRGMECFHSMTDAEVRFMAGFKTGEMTVAAGSTVLMQGASSPQLFTVLSGVGLRYQTLENGRKQIIHFLFPGDFVGLQASISGELTYSVDAATRMVLCCFQRSDLPRLFRNHPERAFDLTWVGAAQEHFLGETIATLGQRSALQRVAWGLLRIYQRLETAHMARDGVAGMPIRQQDLADALGLSLVHTNKTLAQLRERQIAVWRDRELRIADLDALARVALTDLDPLPRRPLI